MKKCVWCGREYPDDASVCPLDDQPLKVIDSAAVRAVPRVQSNQAGLERFQRSLGIAKVSDTRGASLLWWAAKAAILLCLGIGVLWFGISEQLSSLALRSSGIETKGTI